MKKLMIIAILLVVVMAALDIFYVPATKPDEVYEFSNRNIKWYYAGK